MAFRIAGGIAAILPAILNLLKARNALAIPGTFNGARLIAQTELWDACRPDRVPELVLGDRRPDSVCSILLRFLG